LFNQRVVINYPFGSNTENSSETEAKQMNIGIEISDKSSALAKYTIQNKIAQFISQNTRCY